MAPHNNPKCLMHSYAVNSEHRLVFGCVCRLRHGISLQEKKQMNSDNVRCVGKLLVSWNVNSDFLILILITCPCSLGLYSPWPYNFPGWVLAGWQHSWVQGGRLALPLSKPDRHQLPPVQILWNGVSPAEREDSLAQALCVLMTLNSFGRKLMAFQHTEWVECCTSSYQYLLHWSGLLRHTFQWEAKKNG